MQHASMVCGVRRQSYVQCAIFGMRLKRGSGGHPCRKIGQKAAGQHIAQGTKREDGYCTGRLRRLRTGCKRAPTPTHTPRQYLHKRKTAPRHAHYCCWFKRSRVGHTRRAAAATVFTCTQQSDQTHASPKTASPPGAQDTATPPRRSPTGCAKSGDGTKLSNILVL